MVVVAGRVSPCGGSAAGAVPRARSVGHRNSAGERRASRSLRVSTYLHASVLPSHYAVVGASDPVDAAVWSRFGDPLVTNRPRPPRLIWPPFRPASALPRTSIRVQVLLVPRAARSRFALFLRDIEANPRRSFRSPFPDDSEHQSWLDPSGCCPPGVRHHERRAIRLSRRVLNGRRFRFVRRSDGHVGWFISPPAVLVVVRHRPGYSIGTVHYRWAVYQTVCPHHDGRVGRIRRKNR